MYGAATNYLRLMDPSRTWKAFSLSNGTSRTFFYTASGIDYWSVTGWVSKSWNAAGVMTHRDTPGEILPGRSDIFYAFIPTSSIPWRLRVSCVEASRIDQLEKSVQNFTRKIQGLPPSSTKSWSGRRYELMSSEVTP
jgi:hypothetical protein